MNEDKDKLATALMKKATGYDFDEVTEEFCFDDETGEMKKCKQKVNKKHSPPDVSAVRAYFELFKEDIKSKYDSMTEEELLQEKQRLLNELKNS